ncbi:antibiotic biosynthesis monooxygenase family protein [Brasilonema sp. UFV-L1]|uniref:antibiotic biosynthesis monooxygenase family protein n=1 Tax=Brasilonema sp. UFV-L1 TaxID=2234130 RepID=UPI00145F9869|nr:antibiotic biosynthesis monooxygenase family protein [Brasilonema sp. UFV-L1]
MTTITLSHDVATFINIFTVEPTKQKALIDRLKLHAETMISQQAGFISAIAHRSLDGTKVVNYVQWTSVEASKAIHRNPAISAGFASYQEFGVSMDLHYYETVFTQGQPVTIQTHSTLITQIDVLHVAPDNQRLLLERLTHDFNSVAQQSNNRSTIWLRSLDGIRVMTYSKWSHQNNDDAVISNRNQITASEDLIEHIDSNCYEVDFIVNTQGLLV